MIEKMGIGINIVAIDQFAKIPYTKKPAFYKKVFLPSEIEYCLKFKNPYQHFAGKFAIKEAVKKSINEQISMLSIITSHINSKPKVLLVNKIRRKYRFLVSVSHEKNFAVAVVISEPIS